MSAKKRPRSGKLVSMPTAPRSAISRKAALARLSSRARQVEEHLAKIAAIRHRRPPTPKPELTRLLAAVYNRYQRLPDRAANADRRRDFVFHMTDWLDDLERLVRVYKNPKKADRDSAGDTVYGFLIHALPHLMEAGRLLEGHEIRNPFVGK